MKLIPTGSPFTKPSGIVIEGKYLPPYKRQRNITRNLLLGSTRSKEELKTYYSLSKSEERNNEEEV